MEDSRDEVVPVIDPPPRVEAGETTETLVRVTHLSAIRDADLPRILNSALKDADVKGVLNVDVPDMDDALVMLGQRVFVDIPRDEEERRSYVQLVRVERHDDRLAEAPPGYRISHLQPGIDAKGNMYCFVAFEPGY